MSSQELEVLRKSLIARNSDGLKRLYTECKADCINILFSKKYCDKETAEEVYTDAILILRKNLISLKISELSNPVNYLVSVCVNLVRAQNRKEVNKSKKINEVRLLFYDNGHQPVKEEDNKSELIQKCKAALLKLSERCQQIITAYYVHGLRMKEIAEELELSSSDVAKTLKSRCYKKWRDIIKET